MSHRLSDSHEEPNDTMPSELSSIRCDILDLTPDEDPPQTARKRSRVDREGEEFESPEIQRLLYSLYQLNHLSVESLSTLSLDQVSQRSESTPLIVDLDFYKSSSCTKSCNKISQCA
jgi:hypothetical protein